MEQHVNTPPMNNPEQEIDLVEVIRKLWRNRKLILKVTVAFMILGVLVLSLIHISEPTRH